jgi:hypothetical protein
MSNLFEDALDFVEHELQVGRSKPKAYAVPLRLSSKPAPSLPNPTLSPERMRRLEGRVRDLEAKLKETQEELTLKKASNEGLMAQAAALKAALKAAYPKSPLLGPSEAVWKSGALAGKKKTKLRVIWERAFDAAAKRLGEKDPLRKRLS